jgi:ribosomal protein L11 methyltransferase
VAEPRWLEVSLEVNGELAEAVADVLNRYVSNGVVVESGVTFTDEEDEGTPVGPLRVYGYLAIDEGQDGKGENAQNIRLRQLQEALWHLGQISPLPEPTYRPIHDEDWMASWKEHYHPIPVGRRLLVLPAWLEPTDTRRVAVRIDPSMAFGTGTHPTTQLCLEMVEKYVAQGDLAAGRPGTPVIDVGCGSGILSIAALLLGSSHALAVDVDSQAVRSTRENAAANRVDGVLETGLGSVAEIRQGRFSRQQAPLVLANILAPVIIRLFGDGLADLVEAGGVLVLSGILAEQADKVLQAARDHGLSLAEQAQSGDWVVLVVRAVRELHE